jgi:hypothetical protein
LLAGPARATCDRGDRDDVPPRSRYLVGFGDDLAGAVTRIGNRIRGLSIGGQTSDRGLRTGVHPRPWNERPDIG